MTPPSNFPRLLTLTPVAVATLLAAPLRGQPAGTPVQKEASASQPRVYPLASSTGLRLHNVTAEAVTYEGRRGVRVTTSPEA